MEKRLTADLNVVANSNLEIQMLDGDLNIIQKLDDEPNDVGGLTSAELKAKFDESGNIIKKYINETLIPAVLAEDATEESRKQAEAARIAAEQGRVTAEQGRVSAETTRAQAETARTNAETARGNAESQRSSAETTRVDNETARNQGETTRVAAENARANAEMNRNQAEQNRSHSETARDQAETARRNSENIRASSEAERAQAEQNRGSAENNRASAEASRSQGEAARKDAESTRQTNETARQNAESARQTAETNRTEAETARSVWEDYDGAKAYKAGNKVYWEGSSYVCLRPCTGIIPADGTYWQLVVRSGFTADSAFGFDVVNGRLLCYYSGDNPPPFRLGSDGHLYVDLDKSYDLGKVTGDGGSGGADGITPTIGDNGNWYLGDEDTGKPSRGPAGQDGAGMDVTGASVGQIAKITAVDSDGKPTAWEPVDLPSGGKTWEKIGEWTVPEGRQSVKFTQKIENLNTYQQIKAIVVFPAHTPDTDKTRVGFLFGKGYQYFTYRVGVNATYPSVTLIDLFICDNSIEYVVSANNIMNSGPMYGTNLSDLYPLRKGLIEFSAAAPSALSGIFADFNNPHEGYLDGTSIRVYGVKA